VSQGGTLTIVTILLQRDEPAGEGDHRVIPLQLGETAGRWVPKAFDGRSKLQTGLQAGGGQKESPGLDTKARGHGRLSFYTVGTCFSSSDDAATVSLKLEIGAAPIRFTAVLALNRLYRLW
jgi:hypothetical protein